MRKQLLASASAAALAFGLATGAMAQQGPTSDVDGQTTDNTIQAGSADFGNTVVDSGGNISGVNHIQENNGSANVLNLGTNVAAIEDPDANANLEATAQVGSGDPQGNPTLLSDGNSIGSAAGTRENSVDNSYSGATGVTGVQQNNGHANAIGTSHAIAGVSGGPDVDGGAAGPDLTQEATATGKTARNSGTDPNELEIVDGQDRDNGVTNSAFDEFDGVATVQQNNGDGNVMGASTAVTGFTGGNRDVGSLNQTSIAEGVVEDTVSDGITDQGSERRNEVVDSARNVSGIATMQQNNGSSNAVMASTAVMGQAPGLVDGDGAPDDAKNPGQLNQTVEARGQLGLDNDNLTGVQAQDEGSTRQNAIFDNSFDSSTGVLTVQENNGDANTINAATGIASVEDQVNSNDNNDNNGGIEQLARASSNEIQPNEGSDLDVKDDGSTRTNTIRNGFDGVSGTATVQQNNGNANALNAATAVTNAAEDGTPGTEEIRGGVTQTADAGRNSPGGNRVLSLDTDDLGSDRLNRLDQGAFNNIAGDLSVQQNNGDANTMNQATAIVSTVSETYGGVTQNARAENNALNDTSVGNGQIAAVATEGYDRDNTIDRSFRQGDGVANVQQNNGDANTVNAGTAVFGSIAGGGNNPPQAGTINDGLNQQNTLARNNTVEQIDGSNSVDPNGAVDLGGTRTNEITNNSFNDVRGTTNVQQNNGNANTMDAATAVAGARSTDETDGDVNGGVTQSTVGGFANAEGINNDIGGTGNNNDVLVTADSSDIEGQATRDNTIDGSFDDASGIHNVQQNNGDANSINVASAVATVEGDVAGGATQNVDMTGTELRNIETSDAGTNRDNTIADSFGDTGGVVNVQQNNGSANSMNAATAVLLASDVTGTIDQDVDGDATVESSVATSINDSDRDNAVENNAFDGTSGVATLQQNNGDGNYMGTGTAVTSALGEPVTQVTLNGSVSGSTVNVETDGTTSTMDNTVSGSFDNVSGVATVQQNNGNNNVIQSGVTVSANF